jgi:hypothetical protein
MEEKTVLLILIQIFIGSYINYKQKLFLSVFLEPSTQVGVFCLKISHELLLSRNIEFISVNFKTIHHVGVMEQVDISQYTIIHNKNKFLKIYLSEILNLKLFTKLCVRLYTVTYIPH